MRCILHSHYISPPTGLCTSMMLCKVQHKLSSSSSLAIRTEHSGAMDDTQKGFKRGRNERGVTLQSLHLLSSANLSHFTQCYNCFMPWMHSCMFAPLFCVPHFPPYMHFSFLSQLLSAFLAHIARKKHTPSKLRSRYLEKKTVSRWKC